MRRESSFSPLQVLLLRHRVAARLVVELAAQLRVDLVALGRELAGGHRGTSGST